MSSKQNWFWVVVAIGLLGVILVRHHFVHKRPEGPARLVPGLKTSAVTSVQVRPQGQPEIRVERSRGVWVLTDPLSYPAQSISVEALLSALESLNAATYISAAELKNRPEAEEEYGLTNPQDTIILQGDFRERIVIGGRTAPGNQVFVKVGRDPGVFVVEGDLLRLLPKNVNEWRDTTLLDLSGLAPNRISVTNGPRVFELERAETNTWHLLLPGFMARADSLRVQEMIQGLRGIRVREFVTDDPKADLEAFGLQTPDLHLAFRAGTNLLGLLQFGKEVTNETHEIYARRAGQAAVVTVPRELLDPWRVADKFRDPYLISFPAPISSVEVNGQDNFTLESSTNQSWRVMPQNFAADLPLVKDLLSSLSGMQIVAFVRDVVPKSELGPYGLTNYSLRYVVNLASTNSPVKGTNSAPSPATNEIQFGAAQEDKVFVRRTDENNVYAVKLADFQRLGSASWDFRDRKIWNLDENNIANVTIRQEGRVRQINRKAQYEWALAPNSQGMIETFPIDQTVKGLCTLSATAWVARGDQNRSAYGLTNDNYVVTIEMKNGDKYSVELGRPSRSTFPYGGVKLEGDLWIFEFPLKLCRDILAYLKAPPGVP